MRGRRHHAVTCGALLGAASAMTACAGGQTRVGSAFSTDWSDDGGAGVRRVQARVMATPIAKNVAVAVGVDDAGLVGLPLGGGSRWTYAHALDARPQIAGTVVVGTGGGEIFALDAQSGRPLWVRRSAGALHGAGDDGKTTVVTLGAVGESGSVVLAVQHDGTVVRQIEAPPIVGAPAVVGSYAFLPWQGQYVTIYDLGRAEEQARLLFREQVSRAFTHDGHLYLGELGLFRFDEHVSLSAVNQASHATMPITGLPGDPKWFLAGTEKRPTAADARDKIALFAQAAAPEGGSNAGAPAAPEGAGSKLALDQERVVATYYRLAVGYDSVSRAIVWVERNAADWLAGDTFAGGVALCDAEGRIKLLSSRTGAMVSRNDLALGRSIRACVISADGLPTAPEGAATRGTVAEQIGRAIDPTDGDLVAMQKVLVTTLSKLDDPKATQALVALATDARTSPGLMGDIDAALASRRNGADVMLSALARHYDFLKDDLRPPPVGPLADALAAMGERRAAPALAGHLFDPANASNALKRAAAALVLLGTANELPDFRTFFALYHASADDPDLVAAVTSVARALLKLGTADDRAGVAHAAEDPITTQGVRAELELVLK